MSVLPDGTALNVNSSVGSSNIGPYAGVFSSVDHAVSADGSRIYWSESGSSYGPGKLYLRENANQQQSETSGNECIEPEKACTVLVSNKPSQFWAASADGSKAIYAVAEAGTSSGTLYEFSLDEGGSTPIAKKVEGVVGASENLSYIYFVSTEALASGAKGGQPNLYVDHAGELGLVGTLAGADTAGGISAVDRFPTYHEARVTPDGRHVVFASTASLTGYDNRDAVTNEADYEVYVYDAESHVLDCASCDRSGARPTGRVIKRADSADILPLAGSIPEWENQLYAPRVLSDDGMRLFFESYTPLVPQDTNGKADVYEWEAAGSGDCQAQDPAFSPENGGCVRLISSGESTEDSVFLDASPSGGDVFFTTAASLLPQDPGSVDVYDARVDGGFPAPGAPAASCEGEACANAPAPPDDRTPASLTFNGPGDLVPTLTGSLAPRKTIVSATETAARRRAALTKALKACKRRMNAGRRRTCESRARGRFGGAAKTVSVTSKRTGGK